jgi:hypothetical protein
MKYRDKAKHAFFGWVGLIITLIFAVLWSTCSSCCSSKLPPQYISSGVILVPDYRPSIKNSNWCCIDTLIQDPEPGTFITPKDINPMLMIGYDCYGKVKETEFNMIISGNHENRYADN